MSGRAIAIVLALAACSSPAGPEHVRGRIVVAVTIDWEGAYIVDEGLAALERLRVSLGPLPITHFVSAAYLTNGNDEQAFFASMRDAVRPDDELAVHLHLWRSLVVASGIPVRESPSFLTGTAELVGFDNGDIGFDLDPDTHTVAELRALLRTSRRLLAKAGHRVSDSYRAGGYLATPKVMLALRSEGFSADSSAISYRQLDELADTQLPARLAELWPAVSQPYLIGPGSGLVELPIAAVSDYSNVAEIVAAFDNAHALLRQRPDRDVFVVLTGHLETADADAAKLGDAVTAVRQRPDLAGELLFTTIESAAELARLTLTP